MGRMGWGGMERGGMEGAVMKRGRCTGREGGAAGQARPPALTAFCHCPIADS